MKIGIFTDPHYCGADDLGLNRRSNLSLGKAREAMEAFKAQGVERIFCLGDLTDCAKGETVDDTRNYLATLLELIKSYGIPFSLVFGNHDFCGLTREDYKSLNIDTSPTVIEEKEQIFILLDANYRSNMEHFDKAGVQWDDSNLPPLQLDLLKSTLTDAEKPCVVMVHENLDPTVDGNHIIKNHEEIRKIIKESGKVKLVLQGHFHYGSQWYDGDVSYHTVKAMCLGFDNSFEILEI